MHFRRLPDVPCTLLRRTVQRVGAQWYLLLSSRRELPGGKKSHMSGYTYRVVGKSSGGFHSAYYVAWKEDRV